MRIDVEISPEPTDTERALILAVLEGGTDGAPERATGWVRAALPGAEEESVLLEAMPSS